MAPGLWVRNGRVHERHTFAGNIAVDKAGETLKLTAVRNGHPLGIRSGQKQNDPQKENEITVSDRTNISVAPPPKVCTLPKTLGDTCTQLRTRQTVDAVPLGQSAEHAWQAGFCLQYTSQRFRATTALSKLQQDPWGHGGEG